MINKDDEPNVLQIAAIEAALTRLWTLVLGAPVETLQDFVSSGGDSISATKLQGELEAIFDIQLPPGSVLMGSVTSLADIIGRHLRRRRLGAK